MKLEQRGASVLAVVAIGVVASTSPATAGAADPLAAQQWAIGAAGAAPLDADGQGVTVAIIGDGVADHPDLPRIGHVECVRTGGRPERCRDDVSGPVASRTATVAAGVVAARLGNGEGIAGIAPASGVADLRVTDAGVARPEDVDAALLYAAELGAEVALVILPGSLAGASAVDPGAASRALDAGVLVVGGAGAAAHVLDGDAIAVTALDREGRPSGSAPTAARWTLAAPGGTGAGDPASAVLGTDVDGGYVAMSGTWVAAAHVAAAAAVLRSDGLDAATTAQRLVDTAGASSTARAPGRLDVAAARRSDERSAATTGVRAVSDPVTAPTAPVPSPTLAVAAPPEVDAPPRVLTYPAGAASSGSAIAVTPTPAGSSPAGAAHLSPLAIVVALALVVLAAAGAALVRAARHPISTSPTTTKETVHA